MSQPASIRHNRGANKPAKKNIFCFRRTESIKKSTARHLGKFIVFLAPLFSSGCSMSSAAAKDTTSNSYFHLFLGIFILLQIVSINGICLVVYLSRKLAKKDNKEKAPKNATRLTPPWKRKIRIYLFAMIWFVGKFGKIAEFRARIHDDEETEGKRLREHYLYGSCRNDLQEMWSIKRATVHFFVHCFFLNWVCEYFYVWHAAAHDAAKVKMAGIRSDPQYMERMKYTLKMHPILRRMIFSLLILVEPYFLLSKQVLVFFQALKDADAWWMGNLDPEVKAAVEDGMSHRDSRYIQPLDAEEATRSWGGAVPEKRAEIIALLKSAAEKKNKYSPSDIDFRKKIARKIRMPLWMTASEKEKIGLMEVFRTLMEWRVNELREETVWAVAKCLSCDLKSAPKRGSETIENILDFLNAALKNPTLSVRLEVIKELPSLIQAAQTRSIAPAVTALNRMASDAADDPSYLVRDAVKKLFILAAIDEKDKGKPSAGSFRYHFANTR